MRLIIATVFLICLPALVWADVTGDVGLDRAHENMQPYLPLNYQVQTVGVFGLDIGRVRLYAGSESSAPDADADGQLLPIVEHQALFSLLGTAYGGDGRTTFGLPDLRGRAAVGTGNGAGLTPRGRGDSFGTAAATLSASQMPSHTHTHSSGTQTTDPTGSNPASPHLNLQPSLALNYAIATTGTFPSGGAGGQFLGEIGLFAGAIPNQGWAPAEGQLLNIAQHSALFSLLGTTYGGDGRTTFGLPDLQGRVGVHASNGSAGPGLPSTGWGQRYGVEQVVLNAANLPAHNHTLPTAENFTGTTGSGTAHENRQPSLGVNYIVSLLGIYPVGERPFPDGGEQVLGEVRMFAGNFAPRGWAFANGQLLPIAQNAALFSLFGTMYGGDGRTTFALPDLRGRVPIGDGSGFALGARGGQHEVALTTAELPAHSHTFASVTDTDGDGVPDDVDNAPTIPNPDQRDTDGDGIGDVADSDDDNDGVPDDSDNAPTIPNPDQRDQDGDGIGDVADDDLDGDGVPNDVDNAPNHPNPGQEDSDGDGIGDAAEPDSDGDGVPDDSDNAPTFPNPGQEDTDNDGIGDVADNAPNDANPGQEDADSDGVGDVADNAPDDFNPGQEDADDDGVGDVADNAPNDANPGQEDADGDGIGDVADNAPNDPNPGQEDADGDGIGDVADNAPDDFNPGQEDADGDGVGDVADPDDDNDGVPDDEDPAPLDPGQANDPIADAGGLYELLAGEELLLDGTGSFDPDEPFGDAITSFEWDIDGDGIPDFFGPTPLVPLDFFNSLGPEFDVSLTVTDSFGQSNSSIASVMLLNVVPEPASIAIWSLIGLGLAGFGYLRRRRK